MQDEINNVKDLSILNWIFSNGVVSEKIGDAVNQGRGLMEYWIAGMLGLVD